MGSNCAMECSADSVAMLSYEDKIFQRDDFEICDINQYLQDNFVANCTFPAGMITISILPQWNSKRQHSSVLLLSAISSIKDCNTEAKDVTLTNECSREIQKNHSGEECTYATI